MKKYPDILDYYIKIKEENKVGAKSVSEAKVEEVEKIFIENVTSLIQKLQSASEFYKTESQSSFAEALKRVNYLKDVIENKDGYRLFYIDGRPIKKEADLQIMYRLTWHATDLDVNREVNNGRGPVDYTVSKGSADKTLVEFKLASNSKLKSNLEHQVAVYEKVSDTNKSIKVIMYFEASEFAKVKAVLKELKLEDADNIVLIDARNDNKPSASNVK